MRRVSLIWSAGLLVLIACNSTKKPSNENFTNAINQYLAKHGEACTSIGRQFPIDIPASKPTDQYGLGPQIAALQQAGLVSETDTTAVVHGMLDPLRGSTPPQPVKRYQLTTEGQKYFRQVPGTFGQTGGFCYGQKSVDSIVKWTEPVTVEGSSQSEVTYIYKIGNLAAWTQQPDIQQAFPDIRTMVGGASKTNQIAGLQLTNNGWEIPSH
jgi:hypothetical protein